MRQPGLELCLLELFLTKNSHGDLMIVRPVLCLMLLWFFFLGAEVYVGCANECLSAGNAFFVSLPLFIAGNFKMGGWQM